MVQVGKADARSESLARKFYNWSVSPSVFPRRQYSDVGMTVNGVVVEGRRLAALDGTPEYRISNTEYRIPNADCRIQSVCVVSFLLLL